MAQQFSVSLRNSICNILRTTNSIVVALQTFDINRRTTFSSTGAQLEKENISQTGDPPQNEKFLSLYRRLLRLGRQPLSAGTVLDEWVEKGHRVNKRDLEGIIKKLRNYKQYPHALQVQVQVEQVHVELSYLCTLMDHRGNALCVMSRVPLPPLPGEVLGPDHQLIEGLITDCNPLLLDTGLATPAMKTWIFWSWRLVSSDLWLGCSAS